MKISGKNFQVLVLTKRTTYEIYSEHLKSWNIPPRHLARFQATHDNHERALKEVERVLKQLDVQYHVYYRGQTLKTVDCDLVVTVGGDGTFLEAARVLVDQPILGVNSDPERSVGRFCFARRENFKKIFQRFLAGKFRLKKINRLELVWSAAQRKINVLNDILICHANPAAMSRYALKVGHKEEDQKSSGLWISTAAGSTGAIRSAGGKVLLLTSASFQYRPRELYARKNERYRLKGGVVLPSQKIEATSLMKDGKIFVDGSHLSFPFSFGEKIVLRKSLQPLRMVAS